MFTFEQFCEHATSGGQYSWFYLEKKLYDTLTKEEQSTVITDVSCDEVYYRVWHPKDKYIKSMVDKEQTMLHLHRAMENNQIELCLLLSKRLKEFA